MIEIFYTLAGSIAIIAGSGQVRQLIKSGRSDELSLSTWALWFCTQSVSTLYAITLHDSLLILFNSLWVTLYGMMVALIVYYRKYPRTMAELQPQLAQEHE